MKRLLRQKTPKIDYNGYNIEITSIGSLEHTNIVINNIQGYVYHDYRECIYQWDYPQRMEFNFGFQYLIMSRFMNKENMLAKILYRL